MLLRYSEETETSSADPAEIEGLEMLQPEHINFGEGKNKNTWNGKNQ